METLRSLSTIAVFLAFAGIVWWAYAPARRQRFERDALLPFVGEEPVDGVAHARRGNGGPLA